MTNQDQCSCHQGSVCGEACARGLHHEGCAVAEAARALGRLGGLAAAKGRPREQYARMGRAGGRGRAKKGEK
jgi:hypothetical protein